MSIGIIGTTSQTLKISNKVQKVNKVHTYDVSHAVNLFNAQNYACVADLMVNMDRPRNRIHVLAQIRSPNPRVVGS
jgi:hypothetical protein